MKQLILISAIFLVYVNVAGQTPKVKSTSSSGIYNFTKKTGIGDTSYLFTATIDIKNGKEEKVKVNFKAMISVVAWKDYVKKYNNKEKDLFYIITNILAMRAQSALKNTLSFEPLKNQFFFYNDERKIFISKFNMMGRNGYGNMIESSEFVEYDLESLFEKE